VKLKETIIDGNVAYVSLSRGCYATIDAEDVALVDGYNWCASSKKMRCTYALRNYHDDRGKCYTVYMHRIISGAKAKDQVDHRDHDGLNNRKSNIRVCSDAENKRNRVKRTKGLSKHKGVSWCRKTRLWVAHIKHDGKSFRLGCFDREEDAYRAYCEASARLHKEYGCTDSYI